ncbi:MAG: hypothetical protein EPO13_06695 [Actinomycetota bacterium]|nr:MAG: hypothetical protein EPO13_06695 [Actinomycetota bacterium]
MLNRPRTWLAAGAIVAVLVLIAGYFVVVAPQSSSADELTAQAADVDQANAALQTQIAQLKAQQAGLPAQQAKLATMGQQMPPTADLPSLVRTFSDLAAGTGVEILSLAPSPPIPVTNPTAAATGAPAPSSSDPAATASPAATPNAASAPAPATSSVSAIPITLCATGSFANAKLFLSRLETMQRAMLITSMTLGVKGSCAGGSGGSNSAGSGSASTGSASSGSGSLSLQLDSNVFMAPGLQSVATASPAPAAAS